jgi:hypothetical protein
MTVLVFIAHALLLALMGALMYRMASSYRKDMGDSAASARPIQQISVGDEAADCKAQIHLYWAAQLLDMRLKGFDKSRLTHPAIRIEARKYLEGVADCVVDHYQLGSNARQALLDNLESRYLRQPGDDGLTRLRLQSVKANNRGDDSYKTGYAGAASWLRTKRFSSDSSLLAAVHQWGFIG